MGTNEVVARHRGAGTVVVTTAVFMVSAALLAACSCEPFAPGDFGSFGGTPTDIATISAKNCNSSTDEAVSAATHGDTARVHQLLDASKVDHADGHGNTALYCAAVAGHADTVRALLDLGASPNHHSDSGDTALLGAIRFGSAEVVRLLLDHGSVVSDEGRDGETPLMTAAAEKSVVIATVLVDHRADPNQGRRMLDPHTSGSRHPSFTLLDDMTALDAADTPLGISVVRNDEAMFVLLLDHGANPDATQINELLYAANGVDRSKLVVALLDRHQPVTDGRSLIAAAKTGNTELVRKLLDAGVDPNFVGADGTALLWASAFAPDEAVDALLRAGANPNRGGAVPRQVMIDAINFAIDHLHVTRFAQGKDIFNGVLPPTVDVPPLFVAVTWGRVDVIDRLLAAGADVDARAGSFSAIYLATAFRHPDVVRRLLTAHANPNPVVPDGVLSPRDAAGALAYADIEKLLVDAGG